MPKIIYKNKVIAENCKVANTALSRMKGLLGTRSWKEFGSDGLYFIRANSAHSFFLPYSIDIVFLKKNNQIVHTQSLHPWRIAYSLKSSNMLELPHQTITRFNITTDNFLEFQN